MAGQEGLRSLKRSGERAALAERMAVMAEGAGRLEDAVAARLEAWDSGPSLDRLLRVEAAARRASVEEATLAAFVKLLHVDTPECFGHGDPGFSARRSVVGFVHDECGAGT
jgi:hypothetical protein